MKKIRTFMEPGRLCSVSIHKGNILSLWIYRPEEAVETRSAEEMA